MIKKILLVLFIFGLIIVGDFWHSIHKEEVVSEKEFTIDASVSDIPNYIDMYVFDSNFILSWYWDIYLRASGSDTKLKSGEYTIKQDNISRADLIKLLVKGSSHKKTQTLTFIEGWRNVDYLAMLKKEGVRTNDVINGKKIRDVKSEYDFLKDAPDNKDLQGFLFPDTYEVYTDISEEDLMHLLLSTFEKKITAEMLDDIKKQGRNLYDVVTLASIIEKEVRTLKTKQNVSGIFYNRLEIGMALQSDATVNYLTQSGRDRSTLEDLKIDSPYNTYKYKGLPPGPIANPGFDSIYSAIYPIDTNNFFFLTTPEGKIYYANTFNQHVRNKNKYLN